MDSFIDKARKIIQENVYATLGTCGSDGKPWVTPLFVAFDKDFNFYWISPKDSLHSKYLKENNKCSIVLFDSHAPKWTGVGVYISGEANELSDIEQIKEGLTLEFKRLEENTPDYKGFVGTNKYRVYRFVPKTIWITDDIKDKEGNSIDHRTEIKISELSSS